jgi:putative ABC transport system permease protein
LLDAEAQSYDERGDRVAEVLGQVGSGLLLIGFSALFIGGLGVFNSVQAYLQGKLGSLATGLLQWRLDMSPAGLYWTGALTALGVSSVSLGLGARYLLGQMRLNPAMLLRSGG